MKSLRDTPLKILASGFLAIVFLILVAEYFMIRQKIDVLQNVDAKTDFVRSAQVSNQQIAMELQLYLMGRKELAEKVIFLIDQQDHKLKTLEEGGRIDGTEVFIAPLKRLQKITFDNLKLNWNKYKERVQRTLNEPVLEQTNTVSHLDSTSADSIPRIIVEKRIKDTGLAKANTLVSGQWLTMASWYDKLIIDLLEEKDQRDKAINNWFIFISIIDLAIMVSMFWLLKEYVIKPIQLLEANASNQVQTKGIPKNEIGGLANQINDTIEHLKDATEFVEKIGEGNLTMNYQELDSNYAKGKNKLADSLISMQGKLKALNDEEQKRKWSNEGLAKFVDILRSSNDDIHELGNNIISALVKYTGSNQGGLYTLNDEDQNENYLELISLFAFDAKKFEKQKVKLGEGILGQTFLEKETTYLREIPEEYIRITSGLGDANPKSILMVPLKVDQMIYGIVELASFKEYQPHEIAFVEKLGETIASTLASAKSAQRNKQLIEQFQQQTEEMCAQEEEMRQNMEELQATQEEIARKEKSYIARIEELESQTPDNSQQELLKMQEEIAQKERDHRGVIAALERKVAERPVEGDEWALADQVGKELKIGLEALNITRQEIEKNFEKK